MPFFAKGVVLKVKGYVSFFFFFLLYPLLFLNRNNKTNRFERVWWEHTYTEWQGEGQDRKAVIKTGEHKENREFFREVPNAILFLFFCPYSLRVIPISFYIEYFSLYLFFILDNQSISPPRNSSSRPLQLPVLVPVTCGMRRGEEAESKEVQ